MTAQTVSLGPTGAGLTPIWTGESEGVISSFSRVSREEEPLNLLARDLGDGSWEQRFGDLLQLVLRLRIS